MADDSTPANPSADKPAGPRRILSGVQPTGRLHLGNYFGAIKRHIEAQHEPNNECFYFIANYHTITALHDRAAMLDNTFEIAVTYLALGLDPAKTVFYRQSDIPEVTELTWMLSSVTGMGLLERAHSYKDKIARGLTANVGLFTYPALMAADILGPQADIVPVGQDQQQHVEMTRNMAAAFNHAFCQDRDPVFRLPEAEFTPNPKVPGTTFDREDREVSDSPFKRDPETGKRIAAKMSKSYGNTIEIFAEGKPLKKSVMGIETDVKQLEDPLDPDDDLVMEIYRLFATEAEVEEMAAQYRAGGFGYGNAKKALLAKINEYFEPFREKRKYYLAHPDEVEDILRDGANRAAKVIAATTDAARDACGFPPRTR